MYTDTCTHTQTQAHTEIQIMPTSTFRCPEPCSVYRKMVSRIGHSWSYRLSSWSHRLVKMMSSGFNENSFGLHSWPPP